MDDEPDVEAVADFLERKGAIGLLSTANRSGRRFRYLEEHVDVSTATLSKRLKEAEQIGLVKLHAKRIDNRVRNVYYLSPLGEALHYEMHQAGIVQLYRDIQQKKNKLNEQKQNLIEWSSDTERLMDQYETLTELVSEDQDGPQEDLSDDVWSV